MPVRAVLGPGALQRRTGADALDIGVTGLARGHGGAKPLQQAAEQNVQGGEVAQDEVAVLDRRTPAPVQVGIGGLLRLVPAVGRAGVSTVSSTLL